MPSVPNSEAVMVAWLQSLSGPWTGVATQTPRDVSTWSTNGFVTVVTAGGSVADVPIWTPVLSVDTWAVRPDSDRPPWGRAFDLAAVIVQAAWDMASTQVTPTPGNFLPVRVHDVRILTQPRRVLDPDASVAHASMDVHVHWTVAQ